MNIVDSQRGLNLVKTVVQPKLLSSYLVDVPAPPTVEVAVDVPILHLPGTNIDTAGTTPLEAGAAGMLQVGQMQLVPNHLKQELQACYR